MVVVVGVSYALGYLGSCEADQCRRFFFRLSSLLRSPRKDKMDDDDDDEYDSDDTWESDLESEAEIAEIMQLDIAEDTVS